MEHHFSVTFWGVRGSHPVCAADVLRTGGNTTCVEIRAGGHVLIIDAGTGLIPLGRRLAAELEDRPDALVTLLVTHTHYDHTMGFPFFAPAYSASARLHLYGPSTLHQSFRDILTEAMVPPFFPVTLQEMPSSKTIETITEQQEILFADDPCPVVRPAVSAAPVRAADVRVRIHRCLAHPVGGCFVYRVEHAGKSFVFATDVEGYAGGDRRLAQFARGADLLVHDAQYTQDEYLSETAPRQGWGHSTWAMACEVAELAGARRLMLTHHDPGRHDDAVGEIEANARARFPQTQCAREGQTVTLT